MLFAVVRCGGSAWFAGVADVALGWSVTQTPTHGYTLPPVAFGQGWSLAATQHIRRTGTYMLCWAPSLLTQTPPFCPPPRPQAAPGVHRAAAQPAQPRHQADVLETVRYVPVRDSGVPPIKGGMYRGSHVSGRRLIPLRLMDLDGLCLPGLHLDMHLDNVL